jgi:hypothetical protein
VREIRRRTRRKFAPEEKVRIVLEGLRGEQGISELCRIWFVLADTLTSNCAMASPAIIASVRVIAVKIPNLIPFSLRRLSFDRSTKAVNRHACPRGEFGSRRR